MYDKTKFIYVGLDLHKEQHTAVIMDCFNEKFGEVTFQNKPSEFSKLLVKAKRFCTDGKGIVFALENSYGYGRALAAWLIERNYIVNHILSCNTDDSVVIKRITEESGFLRLLSKAVGER